MPRTDCRCAALISVVGMTASVLMMARLVAAPANAESRDGGLALAPRVSDSGWSRVERAAPIHEPWRELLVRKPSTCYPPRIEPPARHDGARTTLRRLALGDDRSSAGA
jgi:hypothetical protein